MKKFISIAIACCMIAAIAATLAFGTFTTHNTTHTSKTEVAWNGAGHGHGGGTENCRYNNGKPICG